MFSVNAEDDLPTHVDGPLLIDLWSELVLLREIRASWARRSASEHVFVNDDSYNENARDLRVELHLGLQSYDWFSCHMTGTLTACCSVSRSAE